MSVLLILAWFLSTVSLIFWLLGMTFTVRIGLSILLIAILLGFVIYMAVRTAIIDEAKKRGK